MQGPESPDTTAQYNGQVTGGTVATIALTGSASGIGAATRAALVAEGQRVIGVDLRDAEVVADLGTADGRAAAIAGVLDAVRRDARRLRGVRRRARHRRPAPPARDRQLLRERRDARRAARRVDPRRGPSAVAVSSCAATVAPVDDDLVAACLAGDEAGRDRARHAGRRGVRERQARAGAAGSAGRRPSGPPPACGSTRSRPATRTRR